MVSPEETSHSQKFRFCSSTGVLTELVHQVRDDLQDRLHCTLRFAGVILGVLCTV